MCYNHPMKCLAVVCMVFALATVLIAQESPVIERLDAANAWINWERQVIKAVGVGVIPGDIENPQEAERLARQAAGINAYRNIEAAIRMARVHGETLVGNVTPEVPEIRLKQLAHSAEIVSDRQQCDRSFEVILQVPLGRVEAVLPQSGKSDWPEDAHPVPYLIDARGLDLLPALRPKFFDKAGNEIFSGMVHYTTEGGIEVKALEVRDLTDIITDPPSGSPGAIIILGPVRESGMPSSSPSPN